MNVLICHDRLTGLPNVSQVRALVLVKRKQLRLITLVAVVLVAAVLFVPTSLVEIRTEYSLRNKAVKVTKT